MIWLVSELETNIEVTYPEPGTQILAGPNWQVLGRLAHAEILDYHERGFAIMMHPGSGDDNEPLVFGRPPAELVD